MELDPSGIE